MEKIYLIIAIVLMLTTIILWVKNGKLKKENSSKDIEISNMTRTIKEKFDHALTLNTKLHELSNAYARINLDLPIRLRFMLDSGEMAHNLKVKTVKDDEGKVIGITSTIRRKINGVYTEVPVVPYIEKP